MTLYLYSFPVEVCIRIWDFILLDGIFGLAKLTIPIIKIFEKDFMTMEAMDVFFSYKILVYGIIPKYNKISTSS